MGKTSEKYSLTGQARLDALCWAAQKAGKSYGQFCSRLTRADEDQIYADYLRFLQEKERAEARRLEAKRNKTARS